MNQIHTCVDILRHIEFNYSNPKAFNWRVDDVWHSLSTEEFVQSVKYLALGLIEIGLQPGERVGILVLTSPQWVIIDFAIMMAGGISVPLFASISDEHFAFEVKQTDIKLIFVGGVEQWDMYDRHAGLFNRAISISDVNRSHVTMMSELVEAGHRLHEADPEKYAKLQAAVLPDHVGKIIYTSGSTGVPKGVEVTQNNMTSLLHNNLYDWDHTTDRYLSVLPLEHIFGGSVNLWLLLWGVSIYYTSDYKNIALICQEIRPTAIVVVPRLLEKFYARMRERIYETKGLKKYLAMFAFYLADHDKRNFLYRLLWPLLNPIVYVKLREGLGNALRVVISGGAPLDPHLHRFFHRIGINIYEGWGMTEACPICVNLPGNNKIGSVGPPLDGIRIQTSPEGEVLVKGPLVMRGYFCNAAATAQTINKEGWLHTGDRGSIDQEGCLTILGRIKELYKTSTGEYVAPVPIEQAICRHPLVESAMVVAEGRKFATLLLFPSPTVLQRMKAKYNVSHVPDELFLKGQHVTAEIDASLSKINETLNHWEQIRGYRFILKPLTIKDGDLTPSMKIRRESVAKKYGELIDTMYQEGSK